MVDTSKTPVRMREAAGGRDDALVVCGLSCERGERELFAGISFEVQGGHLLLVTGPNGSGKSSLLRILAGLLEPSAGSYRPPGRGSFARSVGYLGHANAVKARLSVRENLISWAELARAGKTVEPILQRVGLGAFLDMPAGWLSAGQLRRLALSRILIGGARLWLLDEPAANLDPAGEAVLQAELARHRAAGGSAVVTAPADIAMADAQRLELAGR
jgi:heme exporter protein A